MTAGGSQGALRVKTSEVLTLERNPSRPAGPVRRTAGESLMDDSENNE